jgi:hypothetical protein
MSVAGFFFSLPSLSSFLWRRGEKPFFLVSHPPQNSTNCETNHGEKRTDDDDDRCRLSFSRQRRPERKETLDAVGVERRRFNAKGNGLFSTFFLARDLHFGFSFLSSPPLPALFGYRAQMCVRICLSVLLI